LAERDWSPEIEVLVDYLNRYYLFPDVAERVGEFLQKNLADGVYRSITTEEAFAQAVTEQTVPASGDQHLQLRYSIAELPERDDDIVPESGRHPLEAELGGHGFHKVERLPGNVGLLDFRRFFPTSMSGKVAIGAMHLIAGTDALIIDLGENYGGEPDMVALISSFLFDERTELNALHFPASGTTIQWWTDSYVPEPVYGGSKPIFVLISGDTLSAAEAFAFSLQQERRATLIGETTGGAANFDYRYRVSAHLMFSVPSGEPVNPVSGKGWEGVGIVPDIRIGADLAFGVAYRMALEHVVSLGADDYRRNVAAEAENALARLES
jgi:hypothetical protein